MTADSVGKEDMAVSHLRNWRRQLAALIAAALRQPTTSQGVVVINEEVPGCEPHWYISVPGMKHGDSPKFDKHDGAVAFCDHMGWTYTTSYFVP